jgi:hypothetical protein
VSLYHCEFPKCTGHLSKFPNCLAEALYEVAEDFSDERFGDLDWGFFALFIFHESAVIPAGEWGGLTGADMHIGAGQFLILHESTSGLVSLHSYDMAVTASNRFDELMREFDLWSAVDSEIMEGEFVSHG